MFSYRKIVFGIKSHYQLSNVLLELKKQRFCSLLISQHNVVELDSIECCDRSGEHYHGVAEFIKSEGKTEMFLMLLRHYCMYVNDELCNNPVEYLAYITAAPKRVVVEDFLETSNLPKYLQEIAPNMQEKIMRLKLKRKMSHIEWNWNVIEGINLGLKYGCNHDNLLKRLKKDESLVGSFEERHLDSVSKKALGISKKIILNSRILDLSNRLEVSDEYMSPEESAQFVMDWCSVQNLNPKDFAKNLIRCLDGRSGNRNCVYLQGNQNSGRTFIVKSIIDACIHVGHVCFESSEYAFAWEKCVDQRLIVMWEPYFATRNFDQLDKILAGSGTIVYRRNDIVDYIQPTPVIIVANEHELIDNLELNEKIKKRFACCYMNLKSFPNVNKKKLHPRWLNILNKASSSKSSTTVEMQENLKNYPESRLQSSPAAKNGMEERWNEGDKNSFTPVMKKSGDNGTFKQQILPLNTNQGSQNTMQPNFSYRKYPVNVDVYDRK